MTNKSSANLEVGTSPKTLSAYIIGFLLCMILSATAFLLVGKHLIPRWQLYIAVAALALIQLIVQVVYFLRLNVSPKGQWNLLPFLFSLLVISILVSGSLWIMYNLNYNMLM